MVAAVAAAAVLAVAKGPCALVTPADVKAVLATQPPAAKAQTLGLYQSCTYRAGGKTVTVQTRQIDRATFVKSAKANPGPVKAVAIPGATAYSAAGGFTLLVWKHGTAVTVLVLGATPPLTAEKALALRALAKL
jgi:hypothetical protein